MKQKKVILFGASLGGESYHANHPELEVVAYTDNDKTRWGTQLANRPIISPAEIKNIQFDEIIITSQWFDSIQHQLIHELNIPQEKIVIPPKNANKNTYYPFQHPATLELAQQLLGQITEFFLTKGIITITDSGTALGLVRDGDLIPWDDDIDLAIDDSQFENLVELIPQLLKELPKPELSEWEATLILLSGEGACVNLDLINQAGSGFKDIEISLQRRLTRNGRSELVSSAGIFDAPAHHFHEPKKISFKGQSVFIPNDAEGFLTFMYGNWQTPAKDTSLADYNNREKQTSYDARSIQITKKNIQAAP